MTENAAARVPDAQQTVTEYDLDNWVCDVAEMSRALARREVKGLAGGTLEPGQYRLRLRYPIREPVTFEVYAEQLADLVLEAARIYDHVIYQDWEKYGVRNHYLEELYFEQLTIRGRDVSFAIGS